MGNVAAIQAALSKATRSSSIEAKGRELRNPSWEEENLKREREPLRQGRGGCVWGCQVEEIPDVNYQFLRNPKASL